MAALYNEERIFSGLLTVLHFLNCTAKYKTKAEQSQTVPIPQTMPY